LKDYHTLKEIRTDAEVYRQIEGLMKKITADLSDDKFEGIENYLSDQKVDFNQIAFLEKLSA
jgi:cytochrome c553